MIHIAGLAAGSPVQQRLVPSVGPQFGSEEVTPGHRHPAPTCYRNDRICPSCGCGNTAGRCEQPWARDLGSPCCQTGCPARRPRSHRIELSPDARSPWSRPVTSSHPRSEKPGWKEGRPAAGYRSQISRGCRIRARELAITRPLRREANTFELDAAALIHFDRRLDATYLAACIAPGALVPIHRLQR